MDSKQAYLAMFAFLEKWYAMTHDRDVASLLGRLALREDGEAHDPALGCNWDKAVDEAIGGASDIRLRFE